MEFKSWIELVFFNYFEQFAKENEVEVKIENLKKFQQKEEESELNFLKFEKLYKKENEKKKMNE